MPSKPAFVLAVLLSAAGVCGAPLDDFLAKPDTNYAWSVAKLERHPEGTYAVLDLTSQGWRSAAEVDRPVWRHRLEVYLPTRVDHDLALLDITGGDHDKPGPQGPTSYLADIAIHLHTVVARLWDVPNQPLTFLADPMTQRRREDQILAYAWAQQIGTGDLDWLAQFAMAKSAVRAMDAVTAACAMATTNAVQVKRFVVTGASKRGWASWLAAAGDKRVVGVAPKVIDLLNMDPSFKHHHAVYGRYADAVQDYVRQRIPERMGTPEVEASRRALDPWEYRDRLTMPKLIVNSAGDQFFVCDSWRYYWNDLQGPTYLRYIPNTDHGLNRTAGDTVRSFFACLALDKPMPRYAWKEAAPGRLRIEVTDKPLLVLAWRITNPNGRDFMLKTTGPAWQSKELKPVSPGVYEAASPAPEKGWSALLVELHFPDPAGLSDRLILTTGVTVSPDTYPPDR